MFIFSIFKPLNKYINADVFIVSNYTSTAIPLLYGYFDTGRLGVKRKPSANAFEVEGNASKTTAGSWLANSDMRIKTDIEEYGIPKSVLIKMSDNDTKRADDLLKEDFVQSRPEWQKQIMIMKETGNKAEIQALASKDWHFMTGTYLPTKIDSADWVISIKGILFSENE